MSTVEFARDDPRDLTRRLEAAEAALRELQGRQAMEVEAKIALPAPPARTRTVFANALAEYQEYARLARVEAHRQEVAAREAQVVRDAPKQAKRDKALAAFDEQLASIRAEREALDELERRVAADRVALARKPL